jgi:cation:H+ antiporter
LFYEETIFKMLFQILLLALGLGLLIKGADWLVDGASALARKYNISDLAIGLTIVAFGTSAPEMVVNSIASYQNHDAIVFGNVIGSNIFNLFLILGIVGLITPLTVQSSTVWKEIPWSFGAVIILFVLTNDFLGTGTHILTRFDGIILIAFFGLFLFYVYRQLKTDTSKTEIKHKELPGIKIWIFILLGLSLLIVGGQLVVSQGILLASTMGVSEKIIGLTIIAAGTSLPELATSVVAAFKKNNDIAVGNIIGSNIFNVFLILSVSSFVKPIVYDIKFNTDLYLLAGGTLFLFVAMFTGQKKKLDRWEAGVLLATFVLYTIYLVAKEV